MRNKLIIILVCVTHLCFGQGIQLNRPANFVPFKYEYPIEELYKKYSKEIMDRAKKDSLAMVETIKNGAYKPNFDKLDKHKLPEWFKDAKFGIFYDWGLWSTAGYGQQGYHGNYYPDTYLGYMYQRDGSKLDYHAKTWGEDFERDDFIPLFTAQNFNADSLAKLCAESGARYFVPFAVHQDGYCLWNNSYTHRNSVLLPPHRDFLKEMYTSMRKAQIKCGFYICLYQYEYPIIYQTKLILRTLKAANAPDALMTGYTDFLSAKHNRMITGKIPVKDYNSQMLVPMIKEVIDVYEPDIMWYDAEWYNTTAKNMTDFITSYYFCKNDGKREIAVNDRLGTDSREMHGDFYTSEYNVIIENKDRYWEENRPMGQSYGYNWQDTEETMMSAEGLIEMLVRIVARNGNLMLMICPDNTGKIPPPQINRIKEMGKWLKQNGEAIYRTRPVKTPAEPTNSGDEVWYTQSKDGKHTYATFFKWPGCGFMMLKNASPKWESKVYLLGCDQPLYWYENGGSEKFAYIELPKNMKEKDAPGKYAWVIKYENW